MAVIAPQDLVYTTKASEKYRIDSNGNLGIGTSTAANVHIGKAVITEDIGLLSTVFANPHPALEDGCKVHLLKMADSVHRHERLAAVSHRLMPLARVVMMQNDTDEEVSALAQRIVQYEEAQQWT